MAAHNEVTRFMYYMYNKWSHEEAVRLFGENMGEHIFNKWVACSNRELYFYAELSNEYQQMLVDRANEIYKDV